MLSFFCRIEFASSVDFQMVQANAPADCLSQATASWVANQVYKREYSK